MQLKTIILVGFVLLANCTTARADVFPLSATEQRWLDEHKTIRVAGPKAFPPFHYYDEQGNLQGMASDYLTFIAKQLGLELEISDNLAWPQVLEKTRSHQIDLLACVARTRERESYLDFSDPYLSFPLVIVTGKDAPFVGGLHDLSRKKIAFIKKVSTYEWLQRDRIDVDPLFVDSFSEALEAVALGRADATIQNLAATSYLIDKQGLTNLKIAAPSGYGNYQLHMAARHDWPELVSLLNKALAAMPPEQHNAIRQRWIAVRYEHGISRETVVRWSLMAGGLAICGFAVFFFWNRSLNREISERKRVEQKKEMLIGELTRALDEIKTLRGILPLCSFCKKIRNDKGYWEQVDVYIYKHSEADVSHSICPACAKEHYPDIPILKHRSRPACLDGDTGGQPSCS